jgi:hypothetical protein
MVQKLGQALNSDFAFRFNRLAQSNSAVGAVLLPVTCPRRQCAQFPGETVSLPLVSVQWRPQQIRLGSRLTSWWWRAQLYVTNSVSFTISVKFLYTVYGHFHRFRGIIWDFFAWYREVLHIYRLSNPWHFTTHPCNSQRQEHRKLKTQQNTSGRFRGVDLTVTHLLKWCHMFVVFKTACHTISGTSWILVTPYYFKIYFNNILSSLLRCPKLCQTSTLLVWVIAYEIEIWGVRRTYILVLQSLPYYFNFKNMLIIYRWV